MISRSRIRKLEAALSRSADDAVLCGLEKVVTTGEVPPSGATRRVFDMIESRIAARKAWAAQNDEIEAMVEWAQEAPK